MHQSVLTEFIFLLPRNPIRRNLKQSDFEEGFFGSKQDREIAAANADLEKSATTAAALDSASKMDSAVTDTPRETADKKAGEAERGAGNSKLVVTTLPPVKTKVCLHQMGTYNWKQGCGSGSAEIRINLSRWIRIRIPHSKMPDPGRQK